MSLLNEKNIDSMVIRTGIKKLNNILSTGYLPKHVYCYMGLREAFESSILIKSVVDATTYNKEVLAPTKPHRRNAILIITTENTVVESITSLFAIYNIKLLTPEKVINRLKCGDGMFVTNVDKVTIVIKYYSTEGIHTSDINETINILSSKSRDISMLVLDDIFAINAETPGTELTSLAANYNIPVITAHRLEKQLEFVPTLDTTISETNINSMWKIIESVDWTCLINRDNVEDQCYLGFNLIQNKYSGDIKSGYFRHQFDKKHKMQLIDDILVSDTSSEEPLPVGAFERANVLSKRKPRATTCEIDRVIII